MSSALKPAFLYSQSPIALDTAIIPFTLPSSTKPPALLTRLFSVGRSGLWSFERFFAYPFCAITHLVSPALATYTACLVTIATQQVQPAYSVRSTPVSPGPPYFLEICTSSFLPASVISFVSSSTKTEVSASL